MPKARRGRVFIVQYYYYLPFLVCLFFFLKHEHHTEKRILSGGAGPLAGWLPLISQSRSRNETTKICPPMAQGQIYGFNSLDFKIQFLVFAVFYLLNSFSWHFAYTLHMHDLPGSPSQYPPDVYPAIRDTSLGPLAHGGGHIHAMAPFEDTRDRSSPSKFWKFLPTAPLFLNLGVFVIAKCPCPTFP